MYKEKMIQRTGEKQTTKYRDLEWEKGDPKDLKSIWPHFDTPKDIETKLLICFCTAGR